MRTNFLSHVNIRLCHMPKKTIIYILGGYYLPPIKYFNSNFAKGLLNGTS